MNNLESSQHKAIARRADVSAQWVLKGVTLNAILAVIKLAGGILGHSYALIADGAESTLDIFSSLLVWGGLQVAGQPPDADHPYGHGKAEALAGMIVAITIFLAAAALAWHSAEMILTPHPTPQWWTLVLLVLVVAAKQIFSRHLLKKQGELESSALKAEAWHHQSDAITSAAAFVGIAIAVAGGPGYESADDWAALVACGFIVKNGFNIMKGALGEMMDTAATTEMELAVRMLAEQVDGVRGIEKCRVRKSGLGHLVDIHVQVDGSLTVTRGHEIAHAVKDTLLSGSLAVSDVLVHIEPAP